MEKYQSNEKKSGTLMKREMIKKELQDYKKALYCIDMVEGFVNFGAMANPSYNSLISEQLKIMASLSSTGESLNFIGEGHNEDALEFASYPKHCVLGTKEADFISEFDQYLSLSNSRIYRKNSINGMLNDKLREDIAKMKNLEEAIFMGVCEDLCVMDFVRTYARYLDELNKKVNLFVVASTVDTFDAPNHNREEWKKIARMVMEQAGVIYVENYEELKKKQKILKINK